MSSQTSSTYVALITGCSAGGMGAEFAKALRRKGWRVFATARSTEKMQDLATAGCELLKLDVTSSDSIEAAVKHVREATGDMLHMLVNNAGRGLSGPALTASMTDIHNLYATNVFGVMAVTQAFSPLLATTATKNPDYRPRIVNVGSVAGIRSPPWSGLYASTKAALASYSDALRLEVKGLGIDVLVVAPGVINTGFANNVADYMAQEGAKHTDLQRELYPNLDRIMEERAKALYGGQRAEVAPWSAEQVEVMTRPKVPAYYISGGQSTIYKVMHLLPLWLVDNLLFRKFACWLVKPKRRS